jgi:predicted metal-dependent hydrolase
MQMTTQLWRYHQAEESLAMAVAIAVAVVAAVAAAVVAKLFV